MIGKQSTEFICIDLIDISDLDIVKDDVIEKVMPRITFDF